jgi:hypothetical protein
MAELDEKLPGMQLSYSLPTNGVVFHVTRS